MGKMNIKGGTPFGCASLCGTCAWALIMTGYRESEMAVVCTRVSPNVPVPFKVHECTGYFGKDRPSWDEMKELAINVPASSAKPVGFRAVIAAAKEPEAEVAS